MKIFYENSREQSRTGMYTGGYVAGRSAAYESQALV